jgi:dGTP triphosphohydrolase
LDQITAQLKQEEQDHQLCKEKLANCGADLRAQTALAGSRLRTITDMKLSWMSAEQVVQLKKTLEESTQQERSLRARVQSLSDDLLQACAERDSALSRPSVGDLEQVAKACRQAQEFASNQTQQLKQQLFGV